MIVLPLIADYTECFFSVSSGPCVRSFDTVIANSEASTKTFLRVRDPSYPSKIALCLRTQFLMCRLIQSILILDD